jgi:hypothetical protein
MVDVSRDTNDRSAVQVLIPVDGILDVPHLPARFHPVAGRRARHRRARKRQDVLQPEGAPAVVCAGHLTHHGLGRDKQSTFGGWDMLHPLIKFYRDTLCIEISQRLGRLDITLVDTEPDAKLELEAQRLGTLDVKAWLGLMKLSDKHLEAEEDELNRRPDEGRDTPPDRNGIIAWQHCSRASEVPI